MAMEIERKYLVDPNKFNTREGGKVAVHGYISHNENNLSGIRVTHDMTKHKGYLNIKGNRAPLSPSRIEIKAEISEDDAITLINSLNPDSTIMKKRIRIPYHGNDWDVDVFLGENEGLIIAEIELPYEGYKFDLPPWVTIDVTNDDAFYNSSLIYDPYKKWAWNDNDINHYIKTPGYHIDHLFSLGGEVRLINYKPTTATGDPIDREDIQCTIIEQDPTKIVLGTTYAAQGDRKFTIRKTDVDSGIFNFLIYHNSYGGLESASFFLVNTIEIRGSDGIGIKWRTLIHK